MEGTRVHFFVCLDRDLAIEIAVGYCLGVMILSNQRFSNINEKTNTGLSLEKVKTKFRWILKRHG